ncbi:MAG: hypothetical protein ACJ780_31965, partial [Solirubrobacteraceae bacterium]
MTARKLGIVLAMLCAMAFVAPAVASASASAATKAPTHATSLTRIPVTGTARNGKAFSGRLTVSQFVTRHGKTMALGTLTGKLGN